MEKQIFNGYVITRHRKNVTKLATRLKDRACHLLSGGKNLEETAEVLRSYLKEVEYKGSMYISYMPVSDWNNSDGLFIRNSSGDYTLVSIRPEKETENNNEE